MGRSLTQSGSARLWSPCGGRSARPQVNRSGLLLGPAQYGAEPGRGLFVRLRPHGRSPRATAAVWTIALLLGRPAAAFAAPNREVALQVRSHSWIDGASFDTAAFTALCAQADIALVPTSTSGGARVAVTYREDKGAGFSMFGIPPPVGYGTAISFTLTFVPSGSNKPQFTLTATAETPAGLTKDRFHPEARARFLRSPGYRLACHAIAAALGSPQRLKSILPWAVLDPQARALLVALSFQPRSTIDEAYTAAAWDDHPRLQSLGAAAIEPLLLLFENSMTDRDGIGVLPATQPVNARRLADALAVLTAAQDERIPDALTTFLTDYRDFQDDRDPSVSSVLRAVIKALADIGTFDTLPVLDDWGRGRSAVSDEARAAAASLRKRLVID